MRFYFLLLLQTADDSRYIQTKQFGLIATAVNKNRFVDVAKLFCDEAPLEMPKVECSVLLCRLLECLY